MRQSLVLLRHGESELNAKGALVGRSDPQLTAHGREQARHAAEALASELAGVERLRLLSSPLRRARDTAEIVGAELAAHRHEIGVEIDDRLVEIDYGTYDGLRPGELPRDVWSGWRDDPGFRPPGGETLIELQSRCSELYDELRTKALAAGPRGAEVVLAVCHVSPIKAAVSWALGTGPEIAWRLHLAIASITRLSLGPGRPALLSFGETAHLTRTDPAGGRVGL